MEAVLMFIDSTTVVGASLLLLNSFDLRVPALHAAMVTNDTIKNFRRSIVRIRTINFVQIYLEQVISNR